MANTKRNYKKSLILVIILLVAAFLRLWKLSEVPVSLFGDELDVGYHAYSILKTGRDYSGNFMPLHFHSLAEWRTPLFLYSAVPTIAIFGISPLGVRLPAAFFGILGVWGIYLLANKIFGEKKFSIFKLPRKKITAELSIGEIAAIVLAISPWHIQYSRAAFEVTMLLVFLIFGLYFFLHGLKEGKYMWVAVALIVTTPLIYSTAKIFALGLLIILFLLWRKEIFSLSKKHLLYAIIAGLILGLPTAYATLFEGGTQRFSYIGIFTDPTIETEVGSARLADAMMRGEVKLGTTPALLDRLFHNKIVFWANAMTRNYFKSFSFDFLFVNGDPNPRHSIIGQGMFYKIEIVVLIAGLIFFVTRFNDKKLKALILFWLLGGAVPAALTRDGGDHATRLILMLPPLVFLISYGISTGLELLKGKTKLILVLAYGSIYAINFLFYQHNYWIHNPWLSERWWHAGYKESFEEIKRIDVNYDRVFISMQGEPAWIFFAAWSEYPPNKWHEGFPMNDAYVDGFGGMSYIDKYYFGSPDEAGATIYDLPKFITNDDIYLAVAKEVPYNLITKPQYVPAGLRLVKAIAYPSGEPAFYLFTKS